MNLSFLSQIVFDYIWRYCLIHFNHLLTTFLRFEVQNFWPVVWTSSSCVSKPWLGATTCVLDACGSRSSSWMIETSNASERSEDLSFFLNSLAADDADLYRPSSCRRPHFSANAPTHTIHHRLSHRESPQWGWRFDFSPFRSCLFQHVVLFYQWKNVERHCLKKRQ